MSLFDLNFKSFLGIMWFSYGAGLTVAHHWASGVLFLVLGIVYVLCGEVRLTCAWKR